MNFLFENLHRMMIEQNISKAKLAQDLSISINTVYEILNGNRLNPRPETIHSLAKYFNVDIAEFYNDAISNELRLHKNKKNIYFKSLQEALNHLLISSGVISTTLLHSLTGIPKYTLDRIISGETINPTPEIINKLASFFKLTTTQLTGLDPIYLKSSSIDLENIMIPIIPYTQLNEYLSNTFNGQLTYVATSSKNIGNNSFAVNIDTNLEPYCEEKSILIFDTNKKPTNNDLIILNINMSFDIYEYLENNIKHIATKKVIKKTQQMFIVATAIEITYI